MAEEAPKRSACAWLIGMSRTGGTGLFDLPLADPGCAWQLRMGTLGHGFVQHNFLLVDDRNSQINGAVQLGATLSSYVEAWLQIGSRANRNQRPQSEDSVSTQPTLSLGRTALGLKFHSAWGQLGHVAVQPILRVHSGPFDFGPNFASIDAGIDILGSIDLAPIWPRLPLRLSARVGYLHDRSASLIAALECMSAGATECLAARLVYTTAYDLGQPRLEIGLGVDTRFRVGSGVTIGPQLSYTLSTVTSDGDSVLRAQLAMQLPAISDRDVSARVAQLLTLGARMVLPWSVVLDVGVQVAFSSWGYAMGPKLPQVAGYGALSFALDLFSRPSSAGPGGAWRDADVAFLGSLTEESMASKESTGLLRGAVRDAQSQTPLADAVVRFIGLPQNALLTDKSGAYLSGALPTGPLTVEASRGDHQTARVAVVIRPGETAVANLDLETTVRAGRALLWVEVFEETRPILAAQAALSRYGQSWGLGTAVSEGGAASGGTTSQVIEMTPQQGGLHARVPGGSWRLRVDAVGYLSREQLMVLPPGEERRLRLRLLRRPPSPRARLGIDEIVLAEPLGFIGDPLRPQLNLASLRLLDEVSDLLIHHPELRQIRIQAAGPIDQRQLIAVRDYLVASGTAPERVLAVESSAEPRRDRPPRIIFGIVH